MKNLFKLLLPFDAFDPPALPQQPKSLSSWIRFFRAGGLIFLLYLTPCAALISQDFTYETNNGTITITGYTGLGGPVTIPNTISGLPVTSVGPQSFMRTAITAVMIPDSVTNIAPAAFEECFQLAGLMIPASVIAIGVDAFFQCKALTNIVIPNVGVIPQQAFYGCASLTNVTILTGVVEIGTTAFSECGSLMSITIPDTVTTIGDMAFMNCVSLTGLMFPKSVTNIAPAAIFGCTSLKSITVDPLNPVYSSSDGALFDKNQTTLLKFPGGRPEATAFPGSVTNIALYAFGGAAVTRVVLPDSITKIEQDAFRLCGRLTNAVLGNGITSIPRTLFIYCSSLGSFAIPNSVTNIGDWAFYSCTSLTNVIIPDSVTVIGSTVFGSCTSLRNFTIPDTVISLGDNLFVQCTSLSSVTLSGNLTNLPAGAFYLCSSLTNISIPKSVSFIGDKAFGMCANLAGVFFQGSAPMLPPPQPEFPPDVVGLFPRSYNVIVYYTPGTTGWGTWFVDRPTVLWNPAVNTGDPSFGVRTNNFGFNITGTPDIPIVVEASTNLDASLRVSLLSCTLTNGLIYFSDNSWTNYSGRFYRIRSP